MSIFSGKKSREVSDKAKKDITDLKLTIKLDLQYKSTGYGDSCAVSEVEVTKVLEANSDTKISCLLKEIERTLEQYASEFAEGITNSRHLSDGLIAAQKEEDKE